MRVIQEFIRGEVRISIFSWNNKYLVKLERGAMEQTFKVQQYDVPGEDQLIGLINEHFLSKCNSRFEEMEKDWKDALESL